MRLILLFLLTLLLHTTAIFAQEDQLAAANKSPYHLSLKRELLFVGAGAVTTGTGIYLQGKVPEGTRVELGLGTFADVNSFDRRFGTQFEDDRSRKFSDRLLNFNAGISGFLVLGKRTRRDLPRIALLYGETMALTGGITNLTKVTFRRTRPFVFGPGFDDDRVLDSGDRASLISGHTSISAAGTFFFARVFSDYYPDSKLKPFVWGTAIVLPAAAGYLRVRAAKHFPTDVMAGYAVGAAIGYLVPTLHKRAILPRGMTLSGGTQGILLSYRFP